MNGTITKSEARSVLQQYASHGWALHPRVAVELYEKAEWKLPKHLLPVKQRMMEEEQRVMVAYREWRGAV